MTYQQERLALGLEIRRLRKKAALTGCELAAAMSVSQSKISKIETGAALLSTEDLAALVEALSLPQDRITWLENQLAILRTEYTSWRLAHRQGLAGKQAAVGDLEKQSTILDVFHSAIIPGLAQTRAYAESLLHLVNTTGQRDICPAVDARVERQSILQDSRRRFRFVISEPALWSGFLAPEIARSQLRHLSLLAKQPFIEIDVLPCRSSLMVVPQNNFCMYDLKTVAIETLTAEIELTDPRDVQLYVSLFERLRCTSLNGRDAIDFIDSIELELSR